MSARIESAIVRGSRDRKHCGQVGPILGLDKLGIKRNRAPSSRDPVAHHFEFYIFSAAEENREQNESRRFP